MRKSHLSTKEMQELKLVGVEIQEIARRAGVTGRAVRYRLSPARQSKPQVLQYRLFNAQERRHYIKGISDRYHYVQDDTLMYAVNHGNPWTPQDLDYLREHALTKTKAELAIELGRTLASIMSATRRYKIQWR